MAKACLTGDRAQEGDRSYSETGSQGASQESGAALLRTNSAASAELQLCAPSAVSSQGGQASHLLLPLLFSQLLPLFQEALQDHPSGNLAIDLPEYAWAFNACA